MEEHADSQEVLNPSSSVDIIDIDKEANFADEKYTLDYIDFDQVNTSSHSQKVGFDLINQTEREGPLLSDRGSRLISSTQQNLQMKVIVLDFEICSSCSAHINSMQHDDVSYSIKFEEHYVDEDEILPENSNSSVRRASFQKAGIKKSEPVKIKVVPRYIPKRGSTVSIPRQMALSLNLSQHLKPIEAEDKIIHPVSERNGESKLNEGIIHKSEFVALEEKLLNIEIELQKINQVDQPRVFKRQCDLAILCEDKWSRLYCEQKNIDFESNREKALHVLKTNLDLRRENFGHMTRIDRKRKNSPLKEFKYNQMKMLRQQGGRMNGLGASPYYSNKMCYGVCSTITSVAEGPDYHYSPFIEDPCLLLENQLFELESRMKKMLERGEATLDSEYPQLLEQAQQLRDEWKFRFEQMKRQKSKNGLIQPEQMKNYDIQKCVVLSKQSRRIVANSESNESELQPEARTPTENV